MGKPRRKPERPVWMEYPEAQNYRGGCKVSWNYYAKKEDAELCSKAARHNMGIAESEGFDFGYCSPGSIHLRTDEGEYKDLYEVCLP